MIDKVKIFILVMFISCRITAQQENAVLSENADTSLINTSHLDHLYEKVKIEGREAGIIHIYAEAPDYKWTDAPGEGAACVDDIARAAIFYLRYHAAVDDSMSLEKARSLLDCLFLMQADNGLFYNFINPDMTINKTGSNSQPKADWWTWRALWAMGEAYRYFSDKDKKLASELKESIVRGYSSLNSMIKNYPKTTTVKGIKLPTWLPYQYASDQASVIIMGLIPFYEAVKDTAYLRYIRILSKGIMMMQSGDSLKFPYGAHLSWENTWHAWGASQPEALLRAGGLLKDNEMIKSALKEVNHFYNYLVKEKYLNEFSLSGGKAEKVSKYPQIAYGINPMVSASIEAYRLTSDTKYAERGADFAGWFRGMNAAGKPMYDPKTGRCYDGLVSDEKINLNSGAESTIEALLALLEVEQNPVSRKELQDLMHGRE
ncbi:MAG: hypothetical protein ACM34K_00830 [Bacillota bacterium]